MKIRISAAILVLAMSSLLQADDATTPTAEVKATISRGLAFLAKDAVAWRTEYKCASCHHAGLVIWSMREAKQRGHAVDETVLGELTKWVAESGEGKTGVPRPEGIPKAFNEKAVSFLLALGSNSQPDEESKKGMQLLLKTVVEDQIEDGSWASWPETRPPIFGHSDERATAMATIALLPVAADNESASVARDKGIKWLDSTPTNDDPQSITMRLVLSRRLGRAVDECQGLIQRISERQNEDGGWSQTPEMASDAWATGQALYSLAHADVKPDDPRVKRGQAFLIRTQRDDGSWPMKSRPTKPGDEGAKNLVPIIGGGSAWGVMGLVASDGEDSGAKVNRVP